MLSCENDKVASKFLRARDKPGPARLVCWSQVAVSSSRIVATAASSGSVSACDPCCVSGLDGVPQEAYGVRGHRPRARQASDAEGERLGRWRFRQRCLVETGHVVLTAPLACLAVRLKYENAALVGCYA